MTKIPEENESRKNTNSQKDPEMGTEKMEGENGGKRERGHFECAIMDERDCCLFSIPSLLKSGREQLRVFGPPTHGFPLFLPRD